jgi:MoaA/NifB/PqqE/SkfB family radical SAM enzyme
MVKQPEYIARFNRNIAALFFAALRLGLRRPRWLPFLARTALSQRSAARLRLAWERKGVHVPPLLIVSVTHQCNLNCAGCYAKEHHRPGAGLLDIGRLGTLLDEADQLGISIVMVAGGEPLMRREIFGLTARHPGIVFPLFTNGLLLDGDVIATLRRQCQVIPVISLEGTPEHTDLRRGTGVHQRLLASLSSLQRAGILAGCSLTVTSGNYATVTDPAFIGELSRQGCGIFFFVEYVPVSAGSEALVLSAQQRRDLTGFTKRMQRSHQGLFIAFPGDEDQYGGCLAAGRGFVHVSPEGMLEPCPFAPFADSDLNRMSLTDALRSDLLRAIREQHGKLTETVGGCALWQNREWVQSLAEHKSTADEIDVK